MVELQIDHAANIVLSAAEMSTYAVELLQATPLPPHGRFLRIQAHQIPLSLSAEKASLHRGDRPAMTPEDISALSDVQLQSLQIEMQKAREQIETRQGSTVGQQLFTDALVNRLNLPGPEWLPEQRLTAAQIIKALEGYLFPEIVERTKTSEPFLPPEAISRLDEERRRQNGETWEIHKTDADDWPSDPHAHNVDTGYKLDFRTGDLYDPRKKRADSWVCRMRKKELIELRGRFRTPLPALAV